MIDSNWDIEKYQSEHESDEHWELRKKFLLTHKDKLPEDELVCMAQVFTNVEFLGCRYPAETMIRVAELAKGVVEEFREKKKDCLKRTFVAASDAASSKAKGLNRRSMGGDGEPNAIRNRPMSFVAAGGATIADEHHNDQLDNVQSNFHSPHNTKLALRELPGPFSKFIVIATSDYETANKMSVLNRSVNQNRFQCKFEQEKKGNLVNSTLFLEGIKLSQATSMDSKQAHELAAHTGLEKLRSQCYTLFIKGNLVGQDVGETDLGAEGKPVELMPADNVGSKLMKLMGYTGGGLGSSGQGIVEPIAATRTVRRQGLGIKSDQGFKSTIRTYLRNWLNEGAKSDLIFSNDFSKEDRKQVHEVAQHLGLKSKSYGKEPNRRLVVSRKLRLWDLVIELAQAGGRSDKYQLLQPGEPLPSSDSPQT